MVRRILAATVVMALAAAPAWAGQGTRKDQRIFTDIASRVNGYAQFTIFDDVTASVDNGVVTLAGKVTMPYKRSDIEARVAGVDGVSQVINKITVLPLSIYDDDLRYRISRAIYTNPTFWSYASMARPPIHIIVERGHVRLTGVVNSNVERMLARSLASSHGAFSITNELKTDAEMKTALESQH